MSIEAMKLALEALSKTTEEMFACRDELAERGARPETNKQHQKIWDSAFNAYSCALNAAEKLRAAIEQAQKQEPVAWVECDGELVWNNREAAIGRNLYTAPPQREWQGLTDEEYEATAEQHVTNYYFDTLKYARAIEAKLKEKNYDKS
jgi:uncharacterized protein YukE